MHQEKLKKYQDELDKIIEKDKICKDEVKSRAKRRNILKTIIKQATR